MLSWVNPDFENKCRNQSFLKVFFILLTRDFEQKTMRVRLIFAAPLKQGLGLDWHWNFGHSSYAVYYFWKPFVKKAAQMQCSFCVHLSGMVLVMWAFGLWSAFCRIQTDFVFCFANSTILPHLVRACFWPLENWFFLWRGWGAGDFYGYPLLLNLHFDFRHHLNFPHEWSGLFIGSNLSSNHHP